MWVPQPTALVQQNMQGESGTCEATSRAHQLAFLSGSLEDCEGLSWSQSKLVSD